MQPKPQLRLDVVRVQRTAVSREFAVGSPVGPLDLRPLFARARKYTGPTATDTQTTKPKQHLRLQDLPVDRVVLSPHALEAEVVTDSTASCRSQRRSFRIA